MVDTYFDLIKGDIIMPNDEIMTGNEWRLVKIHNSELIGEKYEEGLSYRIIRKESGKNRDK